MASTTRPFAGWLTLGLGVVHTFATVPAVIAAVPFVAERGLLGGIATDVPPPVDAMPALAALFSLVMGVLLMALGGALVRLERAGLGVPRWLGPTFLATGLISGVLIPPTGFWLVAALGLWLTVRRR